MEDVNNEWVSLSTPRLDELAEKNPFCGDSNKSIIINRARVGDDRFGSPWTEDELKQIGTKLGDYYYFSEGGQPCFGDEQLFEDKREVVNEIGDIRASLSNLSTTVSFAE